MTIREARVRARRVNRVLGLAIVIEILEILRRAPVLLVLAVALLITAGIVVYLWVWWTVGILAVLATARLVSGIVEGWAEHREDDGTDLPF